MTRQIIQDGENLLKSWEALRLFSYPDPASALARATRGNPKANWGMRPSRDIFSDLDQRFLTMSGHPWTCGYGHTGDDVTCDTVYTDVEAEQHLHDDLRSSEDAVERLCKAHLSDHQFAAIVSLIFNIGETAFSTSTVLRDINTQNFPDVPHAFSLWNETEVAGTKQVDPGLVNRREKEIILWSTPDTDAAIKIAAVIPTPIASAATEVVAPAPPPVAKSPAYVGAGVAGLGAVGNWLKNLWDSMTGVDVSGLHDTAQAVADNVKPLIDYSAALKGIFVTCSCVGVGLVVFDEYKKRKKDRGVMTTAETAKATAAIPVSDMPKAGAT